MTTPPLTPAQRHTRALGHLHYEADMMVYCVRWLEREHDHWHDASTIDADCTLRLESMLMHARSLIEFLTAPTGAKRYPDDITRGDLDPASTWTLNSATHTTLRAATNEIHKEIAHLTWQRVDQGQTPSDLFDVRKQDHVTHQVLDALSNWAASLPPADTATVVFQANLVTLRADIGTPLPS